jgi:hypothetical protein
MKKTFYCVMSEVYENGAVKAAITTSQRREKPRNSSRRLPFADCYKAWYETEEAAMAALAQLQRMAVIGEAIRALKGEAA